MVTSTLPVKCALIEDSSVEQETMALFDLPYQWIFPVVFISMTAVIAYCFVKYVILAEDEDDEEEPGVVKKGEQVASAEESTSSPASPQISEQPEKKSRNK